MTSIMSRSHGRKSWSMIRSTPAAAKRRTMARASSGVPSIQRVAPLREPRLAASSASRRRPRAAAALAPPTSSSSRPISMPTIADRAIVAGSRPIARHASSSFAATLGGRRPARGRAQVELVRVPGGETVGPRRSPPPDDDPRPRAADGVRGRPGTSTGFGWNSGLADRTRCAVERPAVRLAPQAVQDRQLVLHQVRALLDRRERQPELAVLELVPAGADADLDPAAAHLIDGRHDLGEDARVPERDRRHQHAQTDPVGVAGQAGDDRPGVGRRLAGRAREAR